MIFLTPEKVIEEGKRLLDIIADYFKKGVNIPQKFNSDSEFRRKVDSFLKDVKKAMEFIQGEIRHLVDSPAYSKGKVKGLRVQESVLMSQQDNLLAYVKR